MIWKWVEGDFLRIGLNVSYRKDRWSRLILMLMIPYWITKREKCENFDALVLNFAHQLRYFIIYFRIRNWKELPKEIKRIIFDITFHKKPLGRIIRLTDLKMVWD